MSETREAIMEVARSTVQAHGYNGLSFRELGKVVGIRSASIHHHFPTKADLGVALVQRYREAARKGLEEVTRKNQDAASCLWQYALGFRLALVDGNRMCLCGVLGAEHDELPEEVRTEVQAFVADNIAWVSGMLSKLKIPSSDVPDWATAIYAAISGAQLTARTASDPSVFDAIIAHYRRCGLLPT